MDKWRQIGVDTRGSKATNQDLTLSLTSKSRVLPRKIRPHWESQTANCSSCHGAGEKAGLRLGYQITSTENRRERSSIASLPTRKDYKLVVPATAEKSWLCQSPPASAATACINYFQSNASCSQSDAGLGAQNIQDLYDWIKSGAPAPTIPALGETNARAAP